MAELRTRRPTGRVAYPLILVEGEEKAGKSYALAQFASSPRVGRTFVLDLGDGTMDEYASLGDYEILEHDGTWPSMIGQIEAACRVPMVDSKPNVVGVDSASKVWLALKAWTDARARQSKAGQKKLTDDPDAEIEASMNLWNDAATRWGRMIQALKSFDGIGVLLADGREVVKVENGAPTKETTWTVEAHKSTTGVASAWVRMRRPHKATLIGVRSLTLDVPEKGLVLPDAGMLDHLVFEVLGAGQAFGSSTAVQAQVGIPKNAAMTRVLETVKRMIPSLSETEAKSEAARLWREGGLPVDRSVEEVGAADLTRVLEAIGQEAATSSDSPPPAPEASTTDETPPATPAPTEPPAEPTLGLSEAMVLEAIWTAWAETHDETGDAPEVEEDPGFWREVVGGLRQSDVVAHLKTLGLPVTPPLPAQRKRLAGALGLDEVRPSEQAPEGWTKTVCTCGQPMLYEDGNVTNTQHVDPSLDADHPAAEPFS